MPHSPSALQLEDDGSIQVGQLKSYESAMLRQDLEAMEFEEIWLLHEELTRILAEKITAEKQELEKRLAPLRDWLERRRESLLHDITSALNREMSS